MKFGANLRKLRKEKGLSQDKLSNIFHVHKATISKWEKGRVPDVETLNKIAEYFNTKIDNLLGNEESELQRAIKRVNSDISQQSKGKATLLLEALIASGGIDGSGEIDEETWALLKNAIKKQAQEFHKK